MSHKRERKRIKIVHSLPCVPMDVDGTIPNVLGLHVLEWCTTATVCVHRVPSQFTITPHGFT